MIRAYLGYLSTYLILILYFLTMDFFQSDVQNFPFEGFTLVAIFVAFALYWPFDSVSGKVKEVISFAEERKLASMWFCYFVGFGTGIFSIVIVLLISINLSVYWGLGVFILFPVFLYPAIYIPLRRVIRNSVYEVSFISGCGKTTTQS